MLHAFGFGDFVAQVGICLVAFDAHEVVKCCMCLFGVIATAWHWAAVFVALVPHMRSLMSGHPLSTFTNFRKQPVPRCLQGSLCAAGVICAAHCIAMRNQAAHALPQVQAPASCCNAATIQHLACTCRTAALYPSTLTITTLPQLRAC